MGVSHQALSVTPRAVLSQAESQGTLASRQSGIGEISRLAFDPLAAGGQGLRRHGGHGGVRVAHRGGIGDHQVQLRAQRSRAPELQTPQHK